MMVYSTSFSTYGASPDTALARGRRTGVFRLRACFVFAISTIIAKTTQTGGFCTGSTGLHLDFDVATSWQTQVHQAVDGLRRRLKYVDEALMDAHLELLATLLVNVRTLDDGKGRLAGRQRDRAGQSRAGTKCRIDDLLGGLIDDLVVIGL